MVLPGGSQCSQVHFKQNLDKQTAPAHFQGDAGEASGNHIHY